MFVTRALLLNSRCRHKPVVPWFALQASPHLCFRQIPNFELASITLWRFYASKGKRKSKKGTQHDQQKIHITAQHQKQYAALMDGDVIGPTHWLQVLDAVRARGKVVWAKVFAASAGSKWCKIAVTHGIQLVSVKRREGGFKDPNDLAIALEAGRAASVGSVNAVALVAHDYDFTVVAEGLKSWGLHVAFVITEGSRHGLRSAFQHVGAEIITYTIGEGLVSPKFKAVLHPNGSSKFEPNDGHQVFVDDESKRNAVEHLTSLGFLEEPDFPIVPAIAKFYHTNQIGPLTVWPDAHALYEFTQLLASQVPHVKWVRWPGGLMYVSPRALDAAKTNKKVREFGTARCYTMLADGGPFIVKDSEHVVESILERLGYLDHQYNADIGEAICTFSQTGANNAVLRQLSICITLKMQMDEKVELLRKAFLAPRGYGQWNISAKDAGARQVLFKMGIIADLEISKKDMFLAMERYAIQENMFLCSTYNARVLQILHEHRVKHNPQIRGNHQVSGGKDAQE